MVISAPSGCKTYARFTSSTCKEMTLVNKLKLVGSTFGAKPDGGAHVESIVDQYQRSEKEMDALSHSRRQAQGPPAVQAVLLQNHQ